MQHHDPALEPVAAPDTNPFRNAAPWRLTRPSASYEAVEQAVDHAGLCKDDPAVFGAIAAYAFDEAECWPAQQQVADDLGRSRESVCRAVQRLIQAGWLRIKEKRWRRGCRWCHNVYELLAAFVVGELTVKRIVRRAHRRARSRVRGEDHTKRTDRADGCGCGWCRVDRASIRRPPPPLPKPLSVTDRWRELDEDKKWFGAAEAWRRWTARYGYLYSSLSAEAV